MEPVGSDSLNDGQMRAAYHRQCLRRWHADSGTLVVDELGLQHGRIRADIAVVNGHLAGFEIKSDFDRLDRLPSQVDGYSAVFDRATLIATPRHLERAEALIPGWWGLVEASQGPCGGVRFATRRRARHNPSVDDFSVAQLLWRTEAQEVLMDLGVEPRALRGNRASLYRLLVSRLSSRELRERVRERMKSRPEWRCPSPLSQGDGSFRPSAK